MCYDGDINYKEDYKLSDPIVHIQFFVLIVILLMGINDICKKIETHNQKTDKLYEEFIKLIREKK